MPSPFETEFAAAAHDALFATFGIAAEYTAPDGTESTGTIRLRRHDALPQVRNDITEERQTAEIIARKSEFPNIVSAGRFTTTDGEVWTIPAESSPRLVNLEWICQCVRENAMGFMSRREADNG